MISPCPRCGSSDIYMSRGFGPGISINAFVECRVCKLIVASKKGELHLARDFWNCLIPERLIKGVNFYESE